ncbi:hypothetical protein [Dyadobacter arcticus]|uniref:Uncharacterized protein n=1 Tax=Dyadobacter arcticus TaxID=1078754 RepID=A0ABX0UN21_9BACT|nr:hypothetical protein [Dyadobacter arcticus]NIJ54377.1 hypothetical protein [Dyadobacter arcticus]
MKKVRQQLICIVLLLPFIQSCTDCDTVDQAITAPVRFAIVNEKGENLVSDQNARYHPDSIKLLAGKENTIQSKAYNSVLNVYVFEAYPPNNASGRTDLILYFNQLDTDTLTTFYTHQKNDCSNYYSYNGFTHNNKEIENQGVIRIVKPN